MATWTVNLISPSSTPPADDITRLTDALTLLRNNFQGATAPSGTGADAYQHWADTTTGLMKVANSTATAWVTVFRLDDGSRPDDQAIWSNAADPTKKAKVDLSGVTAGATRTLKVQDRNGTLADLDDVQKDLPVYAATTNSGNAYSATLAPVPAGLVDGMRVKVKINAANTGAATLNLNGLGAKAITKNGTTALASGDLAAGQVVELAFDGTQFQMISGAPASVSTVNRVSFTASGSWTCPAGVNYIDLTHVGGGGGGANRNGTTNGGGGGGAGATVRRRIAVTPGVQYDITIGAGGAVGSAGGDTTFAVHAGATLSTAKGGQPGSTTGAGGASGGADPQLGGGAGQLVAAAAEANAVVVALASMGGAFNSGSGGGKGGTASVLSTSSGASESYSGVTTPSGTGFKLGGGGGSTPFGAGATGSDSASAAATPTANTGAGGGGADATGTPKAASAGASGYAFIEYVR